MKRKVTASPTEPAKRLRLSHGTVDLVKCKSLREQAEPYRLATAKFGIDALTSTWRLGSNRQIHENHVQSLCRIFGEQGLQREPVENHLLIACSKEEVQRMRDHLAQAEHDVSEREGNSPSWPSFGDWMSVNGSRAEIMAGQHRVEALKLYLRRMSSSNSSHTGAQGLEKDQSWWICDIYDKDRLPAHLSIKLRANRQGSILPDSHGQVWMELATLAAADATLFRGTNAQVQDEMLRALGLSGRVPFPIRRLMTLWKNRSWQPMITRWCSTDLGRETFNVSLWEEMARHRVDDFWFDTFDAVLKSTSRLRGTALGTLKLEDWNILARALPSRCPRDIQSIFFPDAPDHVLSNLESKGHLHRRPKFLTAFDDPTYHRMYQTILAGADLHFPDIQTLFRTGRQLGKILSQVMIHVGHWLNPHPMQISERDNNKPQLWRDFIPAFRVESGDRAEHLARCLQRQIFSLVHPRVDEFSNTSAGAYLASLPAAKHGEDGAYMDRFSLPIWKDLLLTVHQTTATATANVAQGSPCFFQRALATFDALSPRPRSLLSSSPPPRPKPETEHEHDNEHEPGLLNMVTLVLRDAIGRAPQVARLDPALCSARALEALVARIAPVVADWAAVQQVRQQVEQQQVQQHQQQGEGEDEDENEDIIAGEKRGEVLSSSEHGDVKRPMTVSNLDEEEDNNSLLRWGRPVVLAEADPAVVAAAAAEAEAASNKRHVRGRGRGGGGVFDECPETVQMGVLKKRCALEGQDDFEMGRVSIVKILNT